MQEPDFNPQLADAILNDQPPISRSEEVAYTPDGLAQWVDDTVSLNFDVIHDDLWQDMERALPRIRQAYDAHNNGDPMSFYVAKQGGLNDEKLFVLLCDKRVGERPVALWTFE